MGTWARQRGMPYLLLFVPGSLDCDGNLPKKRQRWREKLPGWGQLIWHAITAINSQAAGWSIVSLSGGEFKCHPPKLTTPKWLIKRNVSIQSLGPALFLCHLLHNCSHLQRDLGFYLWVMRILCFVKIRTITISSLFGARQQDVPFLLSFILLLLLLCHIYLCRSLDKQNNALSDLLKGCFMLQLFKKLIFNIIIQCIANGFIAPQG